MRGGGEGKGGGGGGGEGAQPTPFINMPILYNTNIYTRDNKEYSYSSLE